MLKIKIFYWCHRTCPLSRQSERFLLYVLTRSQKIRGTQTSNQSKTSQQVSRETTFQNGFLDQSHKLSSERRLGHFPRSKGCVYAHTNLFVTQEVSPVLHKREMLPIHLPMLRANNSAEGFHKGHFCSGSTSKNAKYSPCSLPRRLVLSKSDQKTSFDRQRKGPQSSFRGGSSQGALGARAPPCVRVYVHSVLNLNI